MYNRVLDVKHNEVNYFKNMDLVVIPVNEMKLDGCCYTYNNNNIHFWINRYEIDEVNNCAVVVKRGKHILYKARGVCECYNFDQVKKAAKIEGWDTYRLTMKKNFNIWEARARAIAARPGRGEMFDVTAYCIEHKHELEAAALKMKDEHLHKGHAYELMIKALHMIVSEPGNQQLVDDFEQCIYMVKRINSGSYYYTYENIINQLIELD